MRGTINKTVTTSLQLPATAQSTHLHSQGGQDALGMDEVGVAKIVQAILLEDLGASLEPVVQTYLLCLLCSVALWDAMTMGH